MILSDDPDSPLFVRNSVGPNRQILTTLAAEGDGFEVVVIDKTGPHVERKFRNRGDAIKYSISCENSL